jgi:hypothetical protein
VVLVERGALADHHDQRAGVDGIAPALTHRGPLSEFRQRPSSLVSNVCSVRIEVSINPGRRLRTTADLGSAVSHSALAGPVGDSLLTILHDGIRLADPRSRRSRRAGEHGRRTGTSAAPWAGGSSRSPDAAAGTDRSCAGAWCDGAARSTCQLSGDSLACSCNVASRFAWSDQPRRAARGNGRLGVGAPLG